MVPNYTVKKTVSQRDFTGVNHFFKQKVSYFTVTANNTIPKRYDIYIAPLYQGIGKKTFRYDFEQVSGGLFLAWK